MGENINVKRVLFISSFMLQKNTGASVAAGQNLKFCRQVFSSHQVDAYAFSFQWKSDRKDIISLASYRTKKETFLSYLNGLTGGLTKSNKRFLVDVFRQNQYEIVFLDGSLLGGLIKSFRSINPAVTIIVFFHNIEHDLFKHVLKTRKSYFPLFLSAAWSEKKAVKNSNYRIVFNDRDNKRMLGLYKVNADLVLPITIDDRLQRANSQNLANSEFFSLLFVGSDFFANVEGIKWFCKNVMPKVNAKLKIVGTGMEKYKVELETDSIEVVGRVDDLDIWYEQSSAVVAPIFSGSGMKIKTVEALMMGKIIMGTKEAWEGYDFCDGVNGFECNTAEAFIEAIKLCSKEICQGMGLSARENYQRNHSNAFLEEQVARFKKKLTDSAV